MTVFVRVVALISTCAAACVIVVFDPQVAVALYGVEEFMSGRMRGLDLQSFVSAIVFLSAGICVGVFIILLLMKTPVLRKISWKEMSWLIGALTLLLASWAMYPTNDLPLMAAAPAALAIASFCLGSRLTTPSD